MYPHWVGSLLWIPVLNLPYAKHGISCLGISQVLTKAVGCDRVWIMRKVCSSKCMKFYACVHALVTPNFRYGTRLHAHNWLKQVPWRWHVKWPRSLRFLNFRYGTRLHAHNWIKQVPWRWHVKWPRSLRFLNFRYGTRLHAHNWLKQVPWRWHVKWPRSLHFFFTNLMRTHYSDRMQTSMEQWLCRYTCEQCSNVTLLQTNQTNHMCWHQQMKWGCNELNEILL